MASAETIDIRSSAFARRLANLLTDRRATSGATLRELVRASDRAFTVSDLKAVERGRAELDEQNVCALAALYGAELAHILPSRMPLRIEPATASGPGGLVSTSGISAPFDPTSPDSLLTSYLVLVRQLRAQQHEPLIDLRREDVETIADYLDQAGPSVVERLSTLMGATQLQRRAMVGLFIAGAIVIGLAGSGVAALASTGEPPSRPAVATTASAVVAPADTVNTMVVTISTVRAVGADAARGSDAFVPSPDPVPALDALDSLAASPDAAIVHPPLADVSDAGTPGAGTALAPAASVTPPPQPAVTVVAVTPTSTVAAPRSRSGSAPPAPAAEPGPAPIGAPNEAPATTLAAAQPPDAATGEPPVPPAPTEAVGEPPVVTDVSTTDPALTIPDLPYDPPAATTVPSAQTAPPPTAESAPPTSAATIPTPPASPATSAPMTTEPEATTEPEVATGPPPIPPSP